MIEAFRSDELIERMGGRFKLVTLIQRRWVQLLQGARPMVEVKGLTELEVVVKEIVDGKIDMDLTDAEDEGDEFRA